MVGFSFGLTGISDIPFRPWSGSTPGLYKSTRYSILLKYDMTIL